MSDFKKQRRNANKHSERGLAELQASLKRDGWIGAITVAADGETFDGSARLETVEKVMSNADPLVIDVDGTRPVIVRRTDIPNADDQRAKRLAVAANVIAAVDWTPDGAVLAELAQSDDILAKMIKADPESMQALKDFEAETGAADAPAQVDRAAELKEKWKTERGQLWAIGDHRLLCGDSTSADDVGRVMGGEKADLGVTSPPYNQGIDKFSPSGMHKEADWVSKVARLAYSDSMPEKEYQDWQRAAIGVWFDIFSDGASFFYNHKNRYRAKKVVSPLEWLPGKFSFRQEIIWKRPGSVTQNARMFLPCDERIYWLYRGDDFYFDDSTENKTYSTIWDIGLETNKTHAVAYPIEIPLRCIKSCSKLGSLVFEPFAGSGTTLVACQNLQRRCRAIEISPAYCAVILERMATAFPGIDIHQVTA